MLAGYNMIGLMPDQDNIIRKATILATMRGASDYLRT